jgi:hypothetical protein
MTVTPNALTEMKAALSEYCDALLASPLSEGVQRQYIDQATNFIRWIEGDYIPGYYLDPRPSRHKYDKPKPAELIPEYLKTIRRLR